MNEQTLKNMESVRHEMFGVLENIGRTKGGDYREMVHSLVMAGNCVDMFDMAMCLADSEFDEDKAMKLRELFISSLFGSLQKAYVSSGTDPDLLCSAINDAQAIGQSAQHLASAALKAGREGRSFGY